MQALDVQTVSQGYCGDELSLIAKASGLASNRAHRNCKYQQSPGAGNSKSWLAYQSIKNSRSLLSLTG